jgi:hypothetical protein
MSENERHTQREMGENKYVRERERESVGWDRDWEGGGGGEVVWREGVRQRQHRVGEVQAARGKVLP